jgi:tRNA G46 methylase TrmB
LKTDSDLLYNYTRKSVKQWGGNIIAKSDNIHGADSSRLGANYIVSTFEKTALSHGSKIKYMAFTLN